MPKACARSTHRQRVLVARIASQEGHQIAHGGEAHALYYGPFHLADPFVDGPGLQPTFELEPKHGELTRQPQPAPGQRFPGDPPLIARDRDPLAFLPQSPGKLRLGRALGAGWIRSEVGTVRQGPAVGRRVRHRLVAHDAADRLPSLHRHGSAEDDPPFSGYYLGLPAAPDDGVAATEEKAVAGEGRLLQGRAVEEVEDGRLGAAVGHIVEDRPVPPRRFLRRQDDHVGFELDLASRVSRREREVVDGLVSARGRVERVVPDRGDFLVRSGRPERDSTRDRLPLQDIEEAQLGQGARRHQECRERGENPASHLDRHVDSSATRSTCTLDSCVISCGRLTTCQVVDWVKHLSRRGSGDSSCCPGSTARRCSTRSGPGRRTMTIGAAATVLAVAVTGSWDSLGRVSDGSAGSRFGELGVAETTAPTPGRLTRDQVVAVLGRATRESPAQLADKDLSGLDLSGLDFRRANLTRSRLLRTNLAKAQMFSATLSDAVATEANFEGATLDLAVMYRVDLTRANLRGSSLFATILIGATLSEADLTGANLRKVNFTRADLTGADLTDADVTGADLRATILKAIRGRDRIRGLDRALNVEQAISKD